MLIVLRFHIIGHKFQFISIILLFPCFVSFDWIPFKVSVSNASEYFIPRFKKGGYRFLDTVKMAGGT